MTWGEKYDNIIKRNQDSGDKDFTASKTAPRCVLVQYIGDRHKCTYCESVCVGDHRYCPNCGAWNYLYDAQFYDIQDDEEDSDDLEGDFDRSVQ